MSRQKAEFAFDLHTGLSAVQVPEFDEIQTIGMCAVLSVHIKGMPPIDYEVLRKVSEYFMAIPSVALKSVLEILADLELVTLITSGKRIETVIPNIPAFDDVYASIGEYIASECSFNEHEQAIILILDALSKAPANQDSLRNSLGVDKELFNRCVVLGNESGIVSSHLARGRPILISPFYFADNLDSLADLAASAGATAIQNALKKISNNQGWPLSIIEKTGEIGGTKVPPAELELIQKLSEEGVMKPPKIQFGSKSEAFVFTPKPGNVRLNGANREIYERAMALISAVRKGQLLADAYRIRSPLAILEALRSRGYLGANSEAKEQYQNLVIMRVAYLSEISPGRWQLHLHRTDENNAAITLAIELLRTGQIANLEVDREARIALTKDESYVQSLISASEMRKKPRALKSEQAVHEFEQLLLKLEA
ncbi:hypothetical protein AA309_05480 [Microvirga vignae]|uniref:F-box domain-containing protein n=1 Tax=Microvirga vignae TaxID=1225564 RepID=A0A0H1RFF4_9HYPH|nr:hypothetical protein [Microvirga vignae]KLK93933.1 hypothetical protein AA309_05480 [Microvirga vignae]